LIPKTQKITCEIWSRRVDSGGYFIKSERNLRRNHYKKIYKRAFALLKKEANSHAARYNLRSGLQLLGPGFSSKNISHVFESEGYQTVTNLILSGKMYHMKLMF
jgi:hypothetical protein